MSDLKMLTKVALLLYGIVCLLFGLMYLFMAETLIQTLVPIGHKEVEPGHLHAIGYLVVVFTVVFTY